jgi:SH3-like domain-containing protein
MHRKPRIKFLLVAALLALASGAQALEFRSVLKHGAIYFDAPDLKAKKLFVVSKGTPVEILATQGDWLRVRDRDGKLAWMSKADLGKRTHVQVVKASTIYAAGSSESAVVFKAEAGLLLELTENTRIGWLRVRHRDGQAGFIRIEDVWGL